MIWEKGSLYMNRFYRSLMRQSGFTLVELMVVVAIIGLLSAVAIPNFKKYQAKAKISEAKLQLSAIYTAETAFFSDYNIYHNCLAYMGFDPGPEILNRYYNVGFGFGTAISTNAYAAAVNSGLNTGDCLSAATPGSGATTATNSLNTSTWFPAGKGVGSAIATSADFLPANGIGDQSSVDAMTFRAGAGGIISQGFITSTNASQLSINEQKVLRIDRNGF
jgi:type IV pilus assembly protein PilA